MPYINERGEIMESRPLWRIGTITDFFQGFARMVALLWILIVQADHRRQGLEGQMQEDLLGHNLDAGLVVLETLTLAR
ncbi:uncharacterized protein [Dermacentor andersoni]|uniref:uncharacterized protein isoform X2 n=1 Tax=Dermacentor andersoni TaxID=34620 RepID=UPI002155ABC1|nr:uncharacterized protein LOC126543907 isoform X2 [Dermacentor andersoni]